MLIQAAAIDFGCSSEHRELLQSRVQYLSQVLTLRKLRGRHVFVSSQKRVSSLTTLHMPFGSHRRAVLASANQTALKQWHKILNWWGRCIAS